MARLNSFSCTRRCAYQPSAPRAPRIAMAAAICHHTCIDAWRCSRSMARWMRGSSESLAHVACSVRAVAEISSSPSSLVFMFPLLLELFLGREKNPLRVRFADAGDPGDLGVAETFDLEEDEDGAALLRQLAEEPRQHETLGVVDVGRRARQRDHVVHRRFLRPPPAAAHGVVAGVDE